MKLSAFSFRQICLCVGLLSLTVPTIARAIPVSSNASMLLIAQATSRAAQAYKSQALGFQIGIPQNYTVDASQEKQGIITLRNQSAPSAVGSDQPAPSAVPGNQPPFVTGEKPQITAEDKIRVATFANPNRLSAEAWAKQNQAQSFFNGIQGQPQQRRFAGQPALTYSWCSSEICGDNIVLPSRDGKQIIVLSALYDYPGDAVRWDFQKIAGQFRFTRR
jgi:hypothetical protein